MDPFRYLIDAGADAATIRKTYLSLAKKLHPDSTDLDPAEATRRMQELNEAYRRALQALEERAKASPEPPKAAAPSSGTAEEAARKARTLVLHFASVVDDYLRNIGRAVAVMPPVREGLERVRTNCACLAAESSAGPLADLAEAFADYADWVVGTLRTAKDRPAEGVALLRRDVDLFLRDLFLENRRLFVRSSLRDLATIFVGRLKGLMGQAQGMAPEETEAVRRLLEAAVGALAVALPALKEHHGKSLIV